MKNRKNKIKNNRKIKKSSVLIVILLLIIIGGIIGTTYYSETTKAQLVNTKTIYENTLQERNITIEEKQKTIDELNIKINELNNQIEELKIAKVKKTTTTTTRSSSETRQTSATISVNGKWIWANVSAYCACVKCCGKTNGITASGAKATANHTIAAPSTYKFGTKIEIAGMGIYTVEDRGGAITGNKLDIYFNTHQEALKFGRRQLQIRVVE